MARKRGRTQGSDTFGIVRQSDWEWIAEQPPCVKDLWIDCWKAEKFGESFYRLETKISKNSWTKAKAALEHLFEFRPIQQQSSNGRWQVVGWEVRNLHGSKSKLPSQQTEKKVTLSPNDWESKQGVLCQPSQQMGEQNAVGFDTTGFDSCLLYSYNSSNIYNEKENASSSSSRSGRLSLDPFTKVTGSSSSPDAQPTQGKELTPTFNEKDSEEAKPTCCDTLVFCEHGLNGFLGRQEEELPVQKMMDRCSKLDRRQNANRNVPNYVAPQPEDPATLADPFATQSDIEPPQPVSQPHVAPSPAPFSSIYVSEVQKLALAGLLNSECYDRLPNFEKALNEGRLCSVIEGFTRTTGEFSFDPDDMVTDYLFNDVTNGELSVFVLTGDHSPVLTPWSKL